MDEFPTQTSREFLPAQGIDSREQGVGREFGAKPIRAPAHPIALKYFIAVDIKIINEITEV
jgi:hypothetical protein